ncbi:a-factor receptor [Ophidiomyces ophidiicola]|nr:a-factor receptor [Ophidiomyces ophidiicola]
MSDQAPLMEMSTQGIILSIAALLATIVCIPPLVWHFRNKNFPAVCLTVWLIIQNTYNFVNPFIWPTDAVDTWWLGPVYCDIQAKLITGAGVGIAGPLACIFRSLAKVLDTDRATLMPSKGEKRRTLAFDIIFCVVIPVFVMAIHYIIQENRYFIYAIVGCMPSYVSSWPSVIVGYMWPPLVLTVAAVYAGIVVYRLVKYKREFNSIVSASTTTTKSRFLRLLILALLMLLGSYPAQLYVLYFNITAFQPWMPFSWSQVHGPDWYVIFKYTMGGKVFFDRWIQVIAGYLLFIFFGFGKDATLMYRSFLLKLGLGRIFPALEHPHLMSSGYGSSGNKSGSFGSRARMLFKKDLQQTMTMSNGSKSDDWNAVILNSVASNDDHRRSTSFSTTKPPPPPPQARAASPRDRRSSPLMPDLELLDAGSILHPSPTAHGKDYDPNSIEVRTSVTVERSRGDNIV